MKLQKLSNVKLEADDMQSVMGQAKEAANAFNTDSRIETGIKLGQFIADALLTIDQAPFEAVAQFLEPHYRHPDHHDVAKRGAHNALRKELGISAATERRLLLLAQWGNEVQAQNPKTLSAAYQMASELARVTRETKEADADVELRAVDTRPLPRNVGGRPKKSPELRAREHLAKAIRFWIEAGLTRDQLAEEVLKDPAD